MHSRKIFFTLDFVVRDYECDLQGIVNNANYQHYFEHTRHQFLKKRGLDFADLHNQGIDAVVVKAIVEYKQPLTSGDDFVVQLSLDRKGKLKIIFNQYILRKSDNILMCTGSFETVLVKQGKPIKADELYNQLISDI